MSLQNVLVKTSSSTNFLVWYSILYYSKGKLNLLNCHFSLRIYFTIYLLNMVISTLINPHRLFNLNVLIYNMCYRSDNALGF